MITKQQLQDGYQLTLVPNRSASWLQVKKLLWIIAAFCFVIAIGWAFVGAWLILPFAGIEVGLLIFIMHRVSRFTLRKEVIVFASDKIFVSSGIDKPTLSWTIDRATARVLLMEVRHPEDPTCIHLADDLNRVELGKHLNFDDKVHLLRELKSADLNVKKIKLPVSIEI